jgi:hypothetical protein
MKTIFTKHRIFVPLLIATLFFVSFSTSYSQFVEKKTPATNKKDSTTKPAKKPEKPVVKTIVREVSSEAYDMPNWSFGAHLSPRFGTNALVEIAPFVAKKLGNKLQGGLGVAYATSRVDNGTTVVSRSHFGARLFTQYYPTKHFFGHAELGAMSIETGGTTTDPNTGQTVTTSNRNLGTDLIFGGGFRFPVGKRLALQVMVLHDMIRQNNATLFGTTQMRLGITF